MQKTQATNDYISSDNAKIYGPLKRKGKLQYSLCFHKLELCMKLIIAQFHSGVINVM